MQAFVLILAFSELSLYSSILKWLMRPPVRDRLGAKESHSALPPYSVLETPWHRQVQVERGRISSIAVTVTTVICEFMLFTMCKVTPAASTTRVCTI